MGLTERMIENIGMGQYLQLFLHVLVAFVLGAIVGWERSKRFKEAGVRTHILVSCGAALFMIVSKYGFADLAAAKEGALGVARSADPARVAAQVVSGISFLGAGVIFRNGSAVKGLTTAAGLWATAGIGLAVGAGGSMYIVGIGGTVLIAVLQVIMHKFKIGGDAPTTRITIEVSDNTGFGEKLSAMIKQWNAKVLETKVAIEEDGSAKYDLTLRMYETLSADDVMQVMSSIDVIKNISCAMAE